MRMWPSIACNVQTQYCTVWEMKLGTVQPTHTKNEAASHLDAECAAATGSRSLRRKFWRPAKLLAASEVLAAKHSSELHLVRASSRAEDLGEGSCAADRSAWRLTVVGWGRGGGGVTCGVVTTLLARSSVLCRQCGVARFLGLQLGLQCHNFVFRRLLEWLDDLKAPKLFKQTSTSFGKTA